MQDENNTPPIFPNPEEELSLTDSTALIPLGGISKVSGVEVIRAMLKSMPSSAGVYRMIGEKGDVLYVGKARQLNQRVANYVNLMQLPVRLQRMVMATRRMEITLTASETEALLLEAHLVKTLKPRYNILLRDDKSFPYIYLSGDHAYPRIAKHRGGKEMKGEYFGPFASAGAVNETINTLQRAFLLRPCSDNIFKNRTRPCLQYQIRRCSAPCVSKISVEDYGNLITQAKRFLQGKGREIQDQLATEMQAASERMDYEAAAVLRDRIRALTHVQQQSYLTAAGLNDADVVALARAGNVVCIQAFSYRQGSNYGSRTYFPERTESEADDAVINAFLGQYYQYQPVPPLILTNIVPCESELLQDALSLLAKRKVEITTPQRGDKRTVVEQAQRNAQESLTRRLAETRWQEEQLARVAELFGLDAPPERIEVYDNSHVMGTNAVGGMIVAGPLGLDKKSYRLFNIKNTELTPGDDYGMMREVLSRRIKRMLARDEEGSRPSLMLIDGGAGQLSAAMGVFHEAGIADICLVAISKGPDRNAGREWFHMPGREAFQLPANDPTLHYLQRLRDEAHRFAIGAHRNRRSKGMRLSELDAIEAIGPSRKRALLQHFGSARDVGAASVEEISKVPGINRDLAQKIYAHFHR